MIFFFLRFFQRFQVPRGSPLFARLGSSLGDGRRRWSGSPGRLEPTGLGRFWELSAFCENLVCFSVLDGFMALCGLLCGLFFWGRVRLVLCLFVWPCSIDFREFYVSGLWFRGGLSFCCHCKQARRRKGLCKTCTVVDFVDFVLSAVCFSWLVDRVSCLLGFGSKTRCIYQFTHRCGSYCSSLKR